MRVFLCVNVLKVYFRDVNQREAVRLVSQCRNDLGTDSWPSQIWLEPCISPRNEAFGIAQTHSLKARILTLI